MDLAFWKKQADDNQQTTPDGWAEGPAGAKMSDVNNIMREHMAAVARHRGDTDGSNVTSGQPNVYSLTLNASSYQYHNDIRYVLCRVHATNTGASTISINGTAAVPLHRRPGLELSAFDLYAGSIYMFFWDGTGYQVVGLAQSTSATVDIDDTLRYYGTGPTLGVKTGVEGNDIVRLLDGGVLPAVNGENLTNLPSPVNAPLRKFVLTDILSYGSALLREPFFGSTALASNRNWRIKFFIMFQSSGSNSGFKFKFDINQTVSAAKMHYVVYDTIGGTSFDVVGVQTLIAKSLTADKVLLLKGEAVLRTPHQPTNLAVEWSKNTSSGVSSKIKAGSYIEYEQLN